MNNKSPEYKVEGTRFKSARALLKLKQEELSKKTGISLAAIKSYERGMSLPKKSFADKLSAAGINMSYIFWGEGPPLLKEIVLPEAKKYVLEKTTKDMAHQIDSILYDIDFPQAHTSLRMTIAELLRSENITLAGAKAMLQIAKDDYFLYEERIHKLQFQLESKAIKSQIELRKVTQKKIA